MDYFARTLAPIRDISMPRLFFILLLAFSTSAHAIVIRHDVAKNEYLATDAPAALVEMRHQGHGVLIAPQWVATAAHLIFYDYRGKAITIGGAEREVELVIFHPGYSRPSEGLFTGDSGPGQAYLRANHDLALVKLKEAVTDVEPLEIYPADDEVGQVFTFFGRGNTGDGLTGQIAESAGTLRQAQNRFSAELDHWLIYEFDRGDAALAREGIQGDGDSGGPALLSRDGKLYVAGLVSWDVYDGDIADFKGGLYGMEGAMIRLSHYADWIAEVIASPAQRLQARHNEVD